MRLLVGGLHEFDGGDDHHEAELVAEGRQSVVDGGSGLDADDGLKRGADLAFAAELFDLLLKVGAYRADGVPLGEEALGAATSGSGSKRSVKIVSLSLGEKTLKASSAVKERTGAIRRRSVFVMYQRAV